MYTHTSTPTYAHAHLNLGACKHTRHVALTQMHTTHKSVFEGRFNHGDTHLRAAAWRWRWPSLDARRDEQSEHWHTSRRHVNSNLRCLSVNALRSQRTDATATLPLQSCRLSQINGQCWPVFFCTTYPLLMGIHAATMQWQKQSENTTWCTEALWEMVPCIWMEVERSVQQKHLRFRTLLIHRDARKNVCYYCI